MFFKVFILVFLVADVYSDDSDLDLGLDLDEQVIIELIIGGRDALPGQFPYMASIQVFKEKRYAHLCGGAIIDERWILTAAHCLPEKYTSAGADIIVKVGTVNLVKEEIGEQVSALEKYFVFPTKNILENDIALIKLRTPLVLNGYVDKIALPKKNSQFIGLGTGSGWGLTKAEPGQIRSPTLKAVKLPIVDNEVCKKMGKKLLASFSLPNSVMCAIPMNEEIGGCNGDSGGPLASVNDEGETEIVGIFSWVTPPCGRKGAPQGFTRVSLYIDWIKSTIEENS